MRKAELIFVPAPGIGHLVSTIEFARRLLNLDDRILITILVMKMPFAPYLDAYTKALTASLPQIQLIDLPKVETPPSELLSKSIEAYLCDLIESYIPHVRNIVSDIVSSRSNSEGIRVAGLVLDFFCDSMIDVGNELGLPSYIFLTSNTGFLGLMLYLPDRYEQISSEVKISDPELIIPGFANPVPPRVLPEAVFNTHGGYAAYVKLGRRFKDAKGIIVNTFAELEPYALNAFSGGLLPPIYPVGPVLNLKGQPHPDQNHSQWEKVKKWLDEQPQSSVLFLCFGSGGSFSEAQTKEIALGLEKSGKKFLWSIRVPPFSQIKDPEDMLPEGFLVRMQGRGMICGWAPQVEVLAHEAIGGFISHCGWNSILESLWYGVPIIALPIYAEQKLNAFLMVREMGLAASLKLDDRANDELVTAEEISRAARYVMESDNEVRKNVREMGEMAKKALMEGGSSSASIAEFVQAIVGIR